MLKTFELQLSFALKTRKLCATMNVTSMSTLKRNKADVFIHRNAIHSL